MQFDAETKGKILFACYCAIGLLVAWLHMRQQKMLESVRQIKSGQAQGLVVYTLAVVWPLLLLSMTLTYFQQKKRAENTTAKKGVSSTES
jgi:heme/copper-type cytochrome/quinol oxidase subunit 2